MPCHDVCCDILEFFLMLTTLFLLTPPILLDYNGLLLWATPFIVFDGFLALRVGSLIILPIRTILFKSICLIKPL